MEEYLQCKLHLLENSSRAVICRETAQFDRVYDTARRCCRETLLVGMDRDDCDLTVRQVEKLEHGFQFTVQERGSQTLHHYHLAMDGDFNIENALAAIGVGRLLGAGHDRMAAALDSLVVPGRMNRYEGGGAHVLVDCMHNRASSQALLTDLKRDYPGAPITVVTGIAGAARPSGSRAWARCAANMLTAFSSPRTIRILTTPATLPAAWPTPPPRAAPPGSPFSWTAPGPWSRPFWRPRQAPSSSWPERATTPSSGSGGICPLRLRPGGGQTRPGPAGKKQ